MSIIVDIGSGVACKISDPYRPTARNPQKSWRNSTKLWVTVAFLIIRNDSIWYEDYAEDYRPDSETNSFSMAKSIVSALLGKAIRDGHIDSIEQPVADFYPQFDPRLEVGDLASMASGLNWEENYYSPFSMTARAYFDENIREQVRNLTKEPGEEFEYLSGKTQLLGMVLEKATGKTLSGYLSESFWKPMGMENDALWQLDSEESGMEKAYCCIASNARDFSRFGKLYKDQGNWKGKQLLDPLTLPGRPGHDLKIPLSTDTAGGWKITSKGTSSICAASMDSTL